MAGAAAPEWAAGAPAPEWAMWQLLDSLLPTGAFAHSLGLEAALRQGWLGGAAGVPGVFPFGPPALGRVSSGPGAGGAIQGSTGVQPEGPSDSGAAVRVFALSAMANVASQLLPFVVAAHVCMAAAAAGAKGTPLGGLVGEDNVSQGVEPGQWAFELVAEGIRATFLGSPTPGEQGCSTNGPEGAVRSPPSPEQGEREESLLLDRALQAWVMLDNILHASLTNHVARRASGTQGTALLRVALTIAETREGGRAVGFPQGGPPAPQPGEQAGKRHEAAKAPDSTSAAAHSLLKTLRSRVGSFRGSHMPPSGGDRPLCAHGHHATVFGAAAALLGVPVQNAARGYLYGALRDVLSASTRLNCIGPLEAAGLQASLAGAGERMLQQSCAWQALVASLDATPSAAGGGAASGTSHAWRSLVGSASVQQPLVDLVHAAHDSLSMRLFLS